ncbi:tyrosine-type recombinase/integrase [Mesorhizobium sophorae]|uniref:tyrosine-type recombinase/integrase n=1 Tax=Mesorhizobium sophorae TaxID=1300294 RepID=UPI000BA2BFE0|nr:tyrosine-type recombinase/integrase [Mesorhizobium sophorae]
MSVHLSLASLLESFFRNRLTKQRNASPSTIASYRDALRMLVLFAAERTGRKPYALAVEDFDRDLILAFLDELEEKRKNTIQTRNARLTAIRSFFHHVAANDPASLGIAQRILAIPVKRSHIEVMHHLSRREVDALIDAPDQQTPRGRRDRALLLFLARTGARVSEALGANACDLQLDRPRPQVLLRGKGRKERVVPIPDDLVKALRALMTERGVNRQEARPLFVGTHENLETAWKRVRRNKGGPGVDGMTIDDAQDYLRKHWPNIRSQLLKGTYQPQPVKRVEIPKPEGGVRKLGVPCVVDRLIQQALLQVLQEQWDPTFSEHSYGFRPGRSAHQAVAQSQCYIAEGYSYVSGAPRHLAIGR